MEGSDTNETWATEAQFPAAADTNILFAITFKLPLQPIQ
jgi:hypothetical protein